MPLNLKALLDLDGVEFTQKKTVSLGLPLDDPYTNRYNAILEEFYIRSSLKYIKFAEEYKKRNKNEIS